jgi:hypothetical protein
MPAFDTKIRETEGLSGGTQNGSQFRRDRRVPGSQRLRSIGGLDRAPLTREAAPRKPPLAGTQYGILIQILNFLLLTTAASQYDADRRQLLMASRTERLATADTAFR